MYDITRKKINEIALGISSAKTREMFLKCFWNTIDTAIKEDDGHGIYVLTGDIPAMWLRDASASIKQYIPFASSDPDIASLIKGVIKKLFFYIGVDPYGNSFTLLPNAGTIWANDQTEKTPYTWERKFEVDSICYPFEIAYEYVKETGDISILDEGFLKASSLILDVIRKERNHHKDSNYSFVRPSNHEPDLPGNGKGGPLKVNGLIWTAFRPSDDASSLGYLVPSNAFASVMLDHLSRLLAVINEKQLSTLANDLSIGVKEAIMQNCIVKGPNGKDILVYETNGLGQNLLMDDANSPSLLSLPYFGFISAKDPLYVETRNFILSKNNPYFFSGKCLTGIGSPHTKKDYVWPMSLSMEGLTSHEISRKKEIIKEIVNADAGTSLTHESVNKDDPTLYTRGWFAWSNSLFSELVLSYLDLARSRGEKL